MIKLFFLFVVHLIQGKKLVDLRFLTSFNFWAYSVVTVVSRLANAINATKDAVTPASIGCMAPKRPGAAIPLQPIDVAL